VLVVGDKLGDRLTLPVEHTVVVKVGDTVEEAQLEAVTVTDPDELDEIDDVGQFVVVALRVGLRVLEELVVPLTVEHTVVVSDGDSVEDTQLETEAVTDPDELDEIDEVGQFVVVALRVGLRVPEGLRELVTEAQVVAVREVE